MVNLGVWGRHAVWPVVAAVLVTGCGSFSASITHNTRPAYRLLQEPDAGYRPITEIIATAQHSVRVAMYELSDDEIVQALIDAHHQRHVEVKVLLDAAFHGRQTNQKAYTELFGSGVDVRWAPPEVIYHEKVVVADDSVAAVGTANLVSKFYSSSRDAFITTTSRADVIPIRATFDADYQAAGSPAHSAATATATQGDRLIWSPAARGRFIEQIDSATQTLIITTEELADRAVLTAIEHAARRGVVCRIVVSENPAWKQAIEEVSTAGCSAHLLPTSASTVFMHEKMLLVDGKALIIGSHNLSTASLLDNRELSLQLDDASAPDVVAGVQSTFERDYQQAAAPPTSSR